MAALRERDTNALQWVQRVGTVPTVAADLPPGPWRRSLGPLIGVRALVPVASVRLSTASLRVVDARGKVVADVLWESRPGTADGSAVRVVPRRGYADEARHASASLGGCDGLAPLGRHSLEVIAGPVVVPPSGLGLVLDPAQAVAETTQSLLRSLWQAMVPIEPWLADPPDSEFLHDYRVALRRSRSVLKQARELLAASTLDEWRPRLRMLQQRTNLARDLDVFLLEFSGYQKLLPGEFAPDLEPLRALLARLRRDEQRNLAAYFGSAEHAAFRDDYSALVSAPPATDGALLAGEATLTVAVQRIRRAHARVMKGGRAITPHSPPGDLHELRILAKELRYALELYGTLFDPSILGALVKDLKQLQDNLGEFQDSEVHSIQVRTFAEQIEDAGGRKVPALMAVGLLAGAFTERQYGARREFAARFAAFSRPAQDKRLESLLASRRKALR